MADQFDKRASARRQALLALLSGTVAEPAAGLAGLYGLVTGGVNKGAHNVEATRDALTYHPRDASALEAVGRAVEPVTGRLQKLRDYLGDKTMAHTGSPALATAGYMVPDTLLTLLGARGMGVKGPKLAQMVARSEGPTMGSPVAQIGAIRAYHGSPHDFDRFSMANIGTGEGAQAYGHGLYFAGNKEVAAGYAKNVPQARASAANGFVDSLPQHMQGDVYNLLKIPHGFRREAALDALRGRLGSHFDEVATVANKKPSLYNVELAPDEADLLDWDAPLSQQPEKVRAALKKVADDYGYEYGDHYSGRDFYHALTTDVNATTSRGAGASADASELLRHHGIPGIRYLDGGSRAAGDGSRNYVMFDDSLVKIKGKE